MFHILYVSSSMNLQRNLIQEMLSQREIPKPGEMQKEED